MKRPLAYITSVWNGDKIDKMIQAAAYSRVLYEAGFSPICPTLYMPMFINSDVPGEHENKITMSKEMLKRSRVLIVCGTEVDETVKTDIATAQKLGITATTLDGILIVSQHGQDEDDD